MSLQPPVGSEVKTENSDSTETNGSQVGQKREAPPDDEDTRAFKLRKKTVATGLGEIYDPGVLPIKIKKREDIKPKTELEPVPTTSGIKSESLEPLKWKPTQWKKTGHTQSTPEDNPSTTDNAGIKQEDLSTEPISSKWAKPQWSEPLPDFKKEERPTIFGSEGTDTKDTIQEQLDEEEKKPYLKTEETPTEVPAGSLFKKRKMPAGAGRGRREI